MVIAEKDKKGYVTLTSVNNNQNLCENMRFDGSNTQSKSLSSLNDSISSAEKLVAVKQGTVSQHQKRIDELKAGRDKVKARVIVLKNDLKKAQLSYDNDGREIEVCKQINSTWQPSKRKDCLSKWYKEREQSYALISNLTIEIEKSEGYNAKYKNYENSISWHNGKIGWYQGQITKVNSEITSLGKDLVSLNRAKITATAIINKDILATKIESFKLLANEKNIALEEKKADYSYKLSADAIKVSSVVANSQADPIIMSATTKLQETKEKENTMKLAIISTIVLILGFIGFKVFKK